MYNPTITIETTTDIYGYEEIRRAFDSRKVSWKIRVKRFFRRLWSGINGRIH